MIDSPACFSYSVVARRDFSTSSTSFGVLKIFNRIADSGKFFVVREVKYRYSLLHIKQAPKPYLRKQAFPAMVSLP